MSDMRTRMEQFFLDNRRYDAGGVLAGSTLRLPKRTSESFTIRCAGSATGYVITADRQSRRGGMGSFVYVYTNTLADARYQIDVIDGALLGKSNAACWVTRKDGSCI